MNKIIAFICIVILELMILSSSYAEWIPVDISGTGDDARAYFIDFERIKKIDNYVYFWQLINSIKPNKYGELSAKKYTQVDCKFLRYKTLNELFFTERMGEGVPSETRLKPDIEWSYPPPNTIIENALESVCSHK